MCNVKQEGKKASQPQAGRLLRQPAACCCAYMAGWYSCCSYRPAVAPAGGGPPLAAAAWQEAVRLVLALLAPSASAEAYTEVGGAIYSTSCRWCPIIVGCGVVWPRRGVHWVLMERRTLTSAWAPRR
jgi:hypothetical protein